ncbi:MAG: ubiquinone/menaquinone biosynthesis methyltransferase [Candidatus Aminicenantes bacterium]|nr:ubiquinone/menaquinone biosynthesis methyltransferase [Candidatus Aminicenantes bacterium]
MKKGIQIIYKEVAPTYELINHVLTFGLDMVWRKRAARNAARIGKKRILDVCSGTGEMAQNLARRLGHPSEIYAADGSSHMIRVAQRKKHMRRVQFVLADAGRLPFPDSSFDLLTISFSSRNLNPDSQSMLLYLKEFYRVLKPSGHFLNLETSQPPLFIIRKLYHSYIRWVVKPIGQKISGSRAGYNYLSHTMPRFYDAPEFSSLCRKAGFSSVYHQLLFLGAAAIHTARK